MKDVTEIDLPKENGEQNNAQEDKLLHFEVKVENRKVEGLITYSTLSTDIQIQGQFCN